MGKTEINEIQKGGIIVECLTMFSTRIGGINIDPNTKPTQVDEATYQKYKEIFDFYVKERVISVIHEGEKQYGKKVEVIKAMEMQEEDEAPRGQSPLKPYVVRKQDRTAESSGKPVVIRTADEIVNGGEKDTICVAATKSGDRCSNERVSGYRVCSIHLKGIRANRNIVDASGETLTLDMVTHD